MRLFLDCEYNDFKGPLISMALVAEDGQDWYEVTYCDNPSPWVAEQVMPILMRPPISMFEMQRSLQYYLEQFDSIHIVADWPEDIAHFCQTLITWPGHRIDTPPLTMEVLRIDSKSDLPHNALYDARGLRDAVLSMTPNPCIR